MGSSFLECKGNLDSAAGVQGASFLSESREGKCRCHSWDKRFILASKEEKYFQKEKRKEESPPHLCCLPARAEPPTCKSPLSLGPGLPPSWISPSPLSLWSKTIVEQRGCENQVDLEGRLSPNNSAGGGNRESHSQRMQA